MNYFVLTVLFIVGLDIRLAGVTMATSKTGAYLAELCVDVTHVMQMDDQVNCRYIIHMASSYKFVSYLKKKFVQLPL